MDDVKIIELPYKSKISKSDYIVIETEDGTQLTNMIGLRDLMSATTTFDTVNDMKNSELYEGAVCITLGYHEKYDGGAAIYIIEYNPVAKSDNASIIKLNTSDTLRAVYLSTGGTVTPEQFGAYGDGVRDDSIAIQKCIDSDYNVIFNPSHAYAIYNSIDIKSNINLDLNGATIIPILCDGFVLGEPSEISTFAAVPMMNGMRSIKISNFTADIRQGFSIINFSKEYISELTITNFTILNTNQCAIKLSMVLRGNIHNGLISGQPELNTAGIYLDLSEFVGYTMALDTVQPLTNINISDIYASNIGAFTKLEKDYGLNNINMRNITYDGIDIESEYSYLFKSSPGNINLNISDSYIRFANSILDMEAHGIVNLNNIYCSSVRNESTVPNATINMSDTVFMG